MKRGKKYIEVRKKKETESLVFKDAIRKIKELNYSKYTGSLEMHISINLPKDKDPKSIKGTYTLPHSTESQVRIAVFTTPENVEKAKKAGADKAGLEDLIKEVQNGNIDFDIAIATPSTMPTIAVLGKELGPKGLMPNPKTGTVTEDIEKTITEYRKGKQTFKADDQGGIHIKIGKLDLEDEKILENIKVVIPAIEEALGKPLQMLIKKIVLSGTMSPSVKIKYEA